jgi:hypothetical protein
MLLGAFGSTNMARVHVLHPGLSDDVDAVVVDGVEACKGRARGCYSLYTTWGEACSGRGAWSMSSFVRRDWRSGQVHPSSFQLPCLAEQLLAGRLTCCGRLKHL